MHPAQQYILQDDERLLYEMDEYVAAMNEGVISFDGIPCLMDAHLPKAVVYLLDPNAITVGGQVLYQNRVGRLTGLKHPDAYEK